MRSGHTLTDNNNTPDAVEPIADEAELKRYIVEQELLRSIKDAADASGDVLESEEELLKRTAELTAQQMLDTDNSDLTPEQIGYKTEWRDAIIVQVIAEGVKKNFLDMLAEQKKGTLKKGVYNKGYMQALNDLYNKLMNIVPEEFRNFQSQVSVYEEENNDGKSATPNDTEGTGTAGESPENGQASGEPTTGDQ
jgi:hypothetical protein